MEVVFSKLKEIEREWSRRFFRRVKERVGKENIELLRIILSLVLVGDFLVVVLFVVIVRFFFISI